MPREPQFRASCREVVFAQQLGLSSMSRTPNVEECKTTQKVLRLHVLGHREVNVEPRPSGGRQKFKPKNPSA